MDECSSVSQRPRKASYVALEERVAVDNLRLVASSAAAKLWKPTGTVSVRTIISDILLCTESGTLVSTWREEGPGYSGRRYSGPPDVRKGDPLYSHFKRLQAKGVNPATIGRSLFGYPSYIRNLARSGLPDLYVLDLVNCHLVILHRRHPTLKHLAHYVENREAVLASIPASRQKAKELFIRLLYGGSPTAWCRDHSVTVESLPEMVWHFHNDMKEASRLDLASNRLYPESAGRIQYLFNTITERQAIDAVQGLLQQRGAQIHALEHDGLCFSLPGADLDELLQACSSTCGFLVTIERAKSFELCLQDLKERSGLDWQPTDSSWEREEQLIARARVESLSSHSLFAEVLLNEEKVSDDIPWPITHLFRLCPHAKELLWYNAKDGIWNEAQGGNGSTLLRHYVTMMLQRLLTTYSTRKSRRFVLEDCRYDLGNKTFREGVEACLRSHLTVASDFCLDPESSRRYVNFGGLAWDRDTEAFLPTQPGMLISRTTGWSHEEFDNPAKELVDNALAIIRAEQDEAGLNAPAAVSETAQEMLNEAASKMPELAFWHEVTKEWEASIYLLTHLARGVFGTPIAEALFVRSSGRSGKDTSCNIMCSLLGTYSYSLSCDSLCSIPSPDAPSPTIASLRARRFVAIREVSEAKMQASVFKRLCDPISELSGRSLYDSPIRFKPQFLTFFCSNSPIQFDKVDAAVRARTAIIDYASIFTSCPTEANHRAWKDLSATIHTFRPGMWWLMTRVYHHLLKGRSMRNVLPIPEASRESAELDCREATAGVWESFLARSLVPAKGPTDATPAAELDSAVSKFMGVEPAAVQLYLQGKGFERVRSKARGRNGLYYRYNFIVGGMKALTPSYVKLVM